MNIFVYFYSRCSSLILSNTHVNFPTSLRNHCIEKIRIFYPFLFQYQKTQEYCCVFRYRSQVSRFFMQKSLWLNHAGFGFTWVSNSKRNSCNLNVRNFLFLCTDTWDFFAYFSVFLKNFPWCTLYYFFFM